MSEAGHIRDPEEIRYARHIANNGRDISHDGRYYYSVSKLRMIHDLPGAIRVGCIIETEKPRDVKQGKDQDFGSIKIMFYVLFEKRQFEILKKKFPEFPFNHPLSEEKCSVFLSWQEYKHAAGIKGSDF